MSKAPADLPPEQREAWQPECRIWTFPLGAGQYGIITVWPCGRGAICWGDHTSFWGSWDGAKLELDEGGAVDKDGWPLDDVPELVEPEVLDRWCKCLLTASWETDETDLEPRGGKVH
ncbi:MAG: hypothetical protein WD382_05950 [Halofilum sp. (in: g-proteobacteria)]